MATLKDKMKINAEKNLKHYEKLLKTLQHSNVENKEQHITDCKHAIEKQKQILSNLKNY